MTTIDHLAKHLGLTPADLTVRLLRFALDCADICAAGARQHADPATPTGPGTAEPATGAPPCDYAVVLASVDQPPAPDLELEPPWPSPMLPEGVSWAALTSKDAPPIWPPAKQGEDLFGDLCVLAIRRVKARGGDAVVRAIAAEIITLLRLPADATSDQERKFRQKVSSTLSRLKSHGQVVLKEKPTGNGKQVTPMWELAP